MITVYLNRDGEGFRHGCPVEQISEELRNEAVLLWVDVPDPAPDELNRLGKEFGFHPLAIEDALRHHERPKLDQYDGYLVIIFYSLELHEARPSPCELTLFVGPNYVMTVHDGGIGALEESRQRWNANAKSNHERGVGFLVYTLLDAIVDGYFPIVDAIAEQVDEMEDVIFTGNQPSVQAEIFRLKKDLFGVRRVVAPERDVMNVLVRRDDPIFDEHVVLYFQDVYDHILRVTDSVDTYRDILSSALDANLSVISFRLNEVVKRLTSFSIVLMSVTLIAGIYGMNFEFMPELGWTFGYPYALGLMLAVAAGLLLFFRRIDWL